MSGYTIELDTDLAVASAERLGDALRKVSQKATKAGQEAGKNFAVGLGTSTRNIQKVFSERFFAEDKDPFKNLKEGGIQKALENLAAQYTQLQTLNNSYTRGIQNLVKHEKALNKALFAKTDVLNEQKVQLARLSALNTKQARAQAKEIHQRKELLKNYETSLKVETAYADLKRSLQLTEAKLNAETKRGIRSLRDSIAAKQVEVKLLEDARRAKYDQILAEGKLRNQLKASSQERLQNIELLKLQIKTEQLKAKVSALNSERGKELAQTLKQLEAEYARLSGRSAKRVADLQAESRAAATLATTYKTSSAASSAGVYSSTAALTGGASLISAKAANDAANATAKLRKHIDLAAQSTASWRAGLAGLGSHMGIYTSSTILAASAVFGLTRAIRGTITLGVDFTRSMMRAFSVMGAGVTDMQRLETQVRRLGKETVFTATEVAEGLVFLGMAGQTTEEALVSLEPTLKLASIGMLDMSKAADIVTNIMSGFHIPATKVKEVVDDMATAVVNANMDVEQLGNAMSYVAPVAEAAGVSIQTVVASLATLHNAGIKASRAGTGLRRVIFNLYGPTTKGAKALAKLGVATADAAGKSRPLIQVLEDLSRSGATLKELGDIVGVRAAPAFLKLIQSASDSTRELQKFRDMLVDNVGAADKLQEKIEDFLGADVKKMGAAFQEIGLISFEMVVDDLRELTQATTEFLKSVTPEQIQTLIESLKVLGKTVAALVAVFASKKLLGMFKGIGTSAVKGVKTFTGYIKDSIPVVGAFKLAMSGTADKAAVAEAKLLKAGSAVKTLASVAGSALLRTGLGILTGGLGFIATWTLGEGLAALVSKLFDLGQASNEAAEGLSKLKKLGSVSDTPQVKRIKSEIDELKAALRERQDYAKALKVLADADVPGADTRLNEASQEIEAMQQQLERLYKNLGNTKRELLETEAHMYQLAIQEVKTGLENAQADYEKQVKLIESLRKNGRGAEASADAWQKGLELQVKIKTDKAQKKLQDLEMALAKVLSQLKEVNEAGTSWAEGGDQIAVALPDQLKAFDEEYKQIHTVVTAREKLAAAEKKYAEARKELGRLSDLAASGRQLDSEQLGRITTLIQTMKEQLKIVKANKAAGDSAAKSFDTNSAKMLSRIASVNKALQAQADARERLEVAKRPVGEQVTYFNEKRLEAAQRYEEALARLNVERERWNKLVADARSKGSVVSRKDVERMKALTTEVETLGKTMTDQTKQYEDALKKAWDLGKQRADKHLKDLLKERRIRESAQDEFGVEARQVDVLMKKLKRLEQLKNDPKGRMTAEEYADAMSKVNREIAMVNAHFKEFNEQLQIGAAEGFARYSDEIRNYAEEMANVTTNALQGMEDAFVDLARTGKLSFRDMVDAMIADLMRLMVRQYVMQPVSSLLQMGVSALMGGIGSTASAPAASMATSDFVFNALKSSVTLGKASGGEFLVGGSGGTDSQLVSFWASPNETVEVKTPGQRARESRTAEGVSYVNQITIDARGADSSVDMKIRAAVEEGARQGYQMVLNDLRRRGQLRAEL